MTCEPTGRINMLGSGSGKIDIGPFGFVVLDSQPEDDCAGPLVCVSLLSSARSDVFSFPEDLSGLMFPDNAVNSTPCCSLAVILVVVMCVLITVVEPALATSKEIRRTKLHVIVESL
jgi:hypothetical protein